MWKKTKNELPSHDDQRVLFILDESVTLGWFRKRHELHGNGLFGCEIDHEKEYFSLDEIQYWFPVPPLY